MSMHVRSGQSGWQRVVVLVPLLLAVAGWPSPGATAPAPVASVVPAAPMDGGQRARSETTYGTLPLAFAANTGQAGADVRFLAHGRGFALALAPDALTLAVGSRQAAVGSGNTGATLRFTFPGANTAPVLTAEQPLPGVVNLFVGNDPARVRFIGLYPGVDLVVYGTEGGGWEYDTIVAPGADPVAFAFTTSGATATLDAGTGELVLCTPVGEMRQHAPVAYQERDGQRLPVAARFAVRDDGSVGFAVGTYDMVLPLVIDPQFSPTFGTYLGGTAGDYGRAVATDGAGNVWVTGVTYSTNFPVTNGSIYGGGDYDVFVTKFNANGTRLFSTYLGGSDSDGYGANGIATDASGNAWVTGETDSGNFPVTNSSTFGGGFNDGFVTKFSASGMRLFSTYLGGSGDDSIRGIATDGGGNVWVTGVSNSANFPGASCGNHPYDDNTNIFAVKFNPSGGRLFSTCFGGSGSDGGSGIAADSGGNVWITGDTDGTDFPIINGTGCVSGQDAFVVKLNTSGARLFSTCLGGGGNDYGRGVATDSGGNVWVTGVTNSTNFPVTNGSTYGGGDDDAFVVKLGTNGVRLFSTYLGGNYFDAGRGVATDASGNAWVTGETDSGNFSVTNGSTYGGSGDAFVVELSASGTRLFSTYLGGSSLDDGFDIATDSGGNVWVVGDASANFPVTNGSLFRGVSDAFVVKLSAYVPPPNATPAPRPTRPPMGQPTPQPVRRTSGPAIGPNTPTPMPQPARR